MMNPDDLISITLTAQEWNNVLVALSDAPYKIAAPLVQKINEQARATETAGVDPSPKPNGEDAHAPH
jgi:hypothetical protein